MFAPIRVTVARAVLALVLLPAVAYAQTDTASIVGTVKDASGAVLPGVTVNLSGPSMMGVQTSITSEDGAYRFIAVPPGDYKLAFELPGFSTVNREGIKIGASFTATGLQPGPLARNNPSQPPNTSASKSRARPGACMPIE